MEAKKENNNIPGPSGIPSGVNFSYYQLEFLWIQKGEELTDSSVIFFKLPDYDVAFTLEEFLEYQKEIFNLSLTNGPELEEICFPEFERVQVEEEILYYCSDLKNNIIVL